MLLRRVAVLAAVAAVVVLAAGCSQGPQETAAQRAAAAQQAYLAKLAKEAKLVQEGRGPVVRLGVVAEMPDVAGMIGTEMGYFRGELGEGVRFEQVTFASDAQAAAALASGRLDAAYLDPVTVVRLWQASGGSLIKIVAGAASGSGDLVVGKDVTAARELSGRPVAAPSGTALAVMSASWLRSQAVAAAPADGADASGAAAVRAFTAGKIAAAWEAAPFDAEMVAAGGHVLAEAPAQAAAAELVVTQRLLARSPAEVSALLKGQVMAEELIASSRPAAQAASGDWLATALGRPLPFSVLQSSFGQVTATEDPLASSVFMQARQAAVGGELKTAGPLGALYDLAPLNAVLRATGLPPVGL